VHIDDFLVQMPQVENLRELLSTDEQRKVLKQFFQRDGAVPEEFCKFAAQSTFLVRRM
jgi:hypothetical protein